MQYLELKKKAYRLIDEWLINTEPNNRKYNELLGLIQNETGFGEKLILERLELRSMRKLLNNNVVAKI